MWTKEHRRAHESKGLRYPSDLTDAEWALVAPLLAPAKRGGRPRHVDMREILNTVFYVLSTGCQWNALPKDLPPKSTVYDYFSLWRSDRTLLRLHQALYAAVREASGRKPGPTVGIIDSQSAKAAQKRGASIDPQGYDAGKKVTGRKRHIVVDTLGMLLNVVVHPASIQDRDGTRRLLRNTARRFPRSSRSSPMPAIGGPRWQRLWPIPALGRLKSSNAPSCTSSSSCPNDGSSNAPSPGYPAIAGLPETSSATPAPSSPSSASP